MSEIDTSFQMGRKAQDRDLSQQRERFADWCSGKFGDCQLVELAPIAEDANGRAGEVFTFTLSDGSRYILRRQSITELPQHMDQDFEAEYLVQKELFKEGVPVCETYFYEEDASVVGSPFYVMAFIEGQIPPDEPSYHLSGWVADLSPKAQTQMCTNSLRAMAQIHKADISKLDLGRLFKRAKPGYTHNDWLIDHWRRYQQWSRGDDPFPTALKALDWLEANKIPNEPLSISWGDSRPGNTIYQGVEVAALIDFDITHLAAPEKDLAWWLTLDNYSAKRAGNVRLPGWLSFEEMISVYEDALGQSVSRERLHYYTVFTGLGVALFIDRTLAITPDVTEEIHEAMMTSPEFSPLFYLEDIMNNKLW